MLISRVGIQETYCNGDRTIENICGDRSDGERALAEGYKCALSPEEAEEIRIQFLYDPEKEDINEIRDMACKYAECDSCRRNKYAYLYYLLGYTPVIINCKEKTWYREENCIKKIAVGSSKYYHYVSCVQSVLVEWWETCRFQDHGFEGMIKKWGYAERLYTACNLYMGYVESIYDNIQIDPSNMKKSICPECQKVYETQYHWKTKYICHWNGKWKIRNDLSSPGPKPLSEEERKIRDEMYKTPEYVRPPSLRERMFPVSSV